MEEDRLQFSSGEDDGIEPWDALEMSKEAFVSLIERIRLNPSCLKNMNGDEGQLVKTVLCSSDVKLSAAVCSQVMGWIIAGEDPKPWLAELKASGHSSICGHVRHFQLIVMCMTAKRDSFHPGFVYAPLTRKIPHDFLCSAQFAKSSKKLLCFAWQNRFRIRMH
jgi:hypothetical protein